MDFSKVKKWEIGGKEVKILTINGQTYWKKEEVPTINYFYVEDTSGTDNSLTLKKTGSAPDIKLEYSTDGKQWQEWVDLYNSPLPIAPNGRVYLRGTNNTFGETSNGNTIKTTKNFNVGGDVTTLLVPEGGLTDLSGRDYCFCNLFFKSSYLQNAKDLVMPSTTLEPYCYSYMFYYCSSLVTAPALPATTLEPYCYSYMFYYCTSLVTAPALPATTLANNCYQDMFYYCTSLVNAPELPATTLADFCYKEMFVGCSKLVTAPKVLPATTLADYCYWRMFKGCYSLVTAPELPATTLAPYCYKEMFVGCSSLVNAPELPATTLADYCYSNMFYGCSKLNSIKVGAKSWSYRTSQNWLVGVASTGTFTKPKELTNIPTDSSGIPEGWTIVDV